MKRSDRCKVGKVGRIGLQYREDRHRRQFREGKLRLKQVDLRKVSDRQLRCCGNSRREMSDPPNNVKEGDETNKCEVLPALAAKIASRIMSALQPRLMFMTFVAPGSSAPSSNVRRCETKAAP